MRRSDEEGAKKKDKKKDKKDKKKDKKSDAPLPKLIPRSLGGDKNTKAKNKFSKTPCLVSCLV